MRGELTAIIESAPEGGYWATCPEIPGANGQGETVEDAKSEMALGPGGACLAPAYGILYAFG
jgi:hypothetical protein